MQIQALALIYMVAALSPHVTSLSVFQSKNGPLTSLLLFQSEKLVVGGRNSLYQFSPGNISNSNLEFELDTRCMKQTCDHSPNLTNDVSILSETTDFHNTDLILVCGTENQQRCYVIKDMNITECANVTEEANQPYALLNKTKCVEVSGATLGSRTSAYAVTTTRKNKESNVFIFSAVDDPVRQNPTFSMKRISPSNFKLYVQSDTTITAKEGEHLEFVYGFEERGYNKGTLYVYILRNNRTDATTKAYIGQVCSGDYHLTSYIETRLSCGDYDILESAYSYSSDLKGPLLLAAFSSSRHQGSALCAFNVTELDGWFRTEKEKCFHDAKGSWPSWIKPTPKTDGHSCSTKLRPHINDIYCARRANKMIRASRDLERQHILMDVERVVTSVAMASQDDTFTVYLGDRTGHVTKMVFDANFNQSLKLYTLDTSDGEPINKGMLLDEARNHLYFTYGDKVAMITTNNCSLHTNCLGCLSDRASSCRWVMTGPSDPRGTCERMDSGSETGSGNSSELVDNCLPVIHKVWPLTGPVSGGTNLTISGQFDGLPTDPGELNVTLGPMTACNVTLVRNDRIDCTTTNVSTETSEAAVTVSWFDRGHTNKLSVPINGTFTYQHSFIYKTPTVSPSEKIFVRQSGGVQIQVFGSNLDIGSMRRVEIHDVSTEWFDECVITKYDRVTDNTITCRTPAIANCDGFHGARIIIDGSVLPGPDIVCLDDPVLQSVTPNKTIKSGGVKITFSGTDFRGLGKSQMYLSLLDNVSNTVNTSPGDCLLVGEQLECMSGAANLLKTNHQMPVECSVLVQNVYRDATTFLANGSIDVVNDPEFSKQITTVYMTSDKEELILKGHYLLNVEESEIFIDVGPENCTIVSIDDDILKCIYDVTDGMKDGRTLQVNATIGLRKYAIGYATYMHQPSTPKPKVAPVTVQASSGSLYFGLGIAVIVGLMALAVSCYVIRKRKKRGVNLGDRYSATYRNGEFVALSGLSESHAAETEQNQQNVYHQQTFAKSLSENDNACAAETEPLLIDENTRLLLENQNLLIDRNCLVMAEVIGQGNFGCVYKCFYSAPGEKEEKIVAAKTLHRQEPRDLDVQMFLKEALLMKDFHHRHVMELIGICLGLDRLPLVVLPYMRAGDLLSYLRDANNSPTVSNLVTFGIDIANGMHYLSELKFVHRDLAARNCMLTDDLTVKIADFGLSRDVYEKEYYSSSDKNAKLPIKWMSPESLEFRTFSSKSDVWAYGVVLWELLTRGMTPYPTVDNWEILRYLQEGRRMAKPDHCPSKVYKIMRRCWEWGPDDRPTFGQLTIEMPEILQNPK